MTTLVTGGAGYIGSHTVKALRAAGRSVVVLDTMELGHRQAVLGAPLVVGDIADQALVRSLVAEHGVDSCIHFAAYKAAGESMHLPERYFHNNVSGSLQLIEALHQSGVDRLVFSSTCAVYGTPKASPVSEDAPLHPESPYGESKLMVEQMLRWFDRCHGFRSVALRYFNAAGASMDGDIGEDWSTVLNLMPLVMKAALGRIPKLQVFGTDYPTPDGTAIRDYIHVDDLAAAHVKALDHLERGGASVTLNVGTGVGSSVQEVIDAARRISRADIPVDEVDRRPGDPVATYADNDEVRRVLGWEPRYGLEEIVASAWKWHSTHPDGFAD